MRHIFGACIRHTKHCLDSQIHLYGLIFCPQVEENKCGILFYCEIHFCVQNQEKKYIFVRKTSLAEKKHMIKKTQLFVLCPSYCSWNVSTTFWYNFYDRREKIMSNIFKSALYACNFQPVSRINWFIVRQIWTLNPSSSVCGHVCNMGLYHLPILFSKCYYLLSLESSLIVWTGLLAAPWIIVCWRGRWICDIAMMGSDPTVIIRPQVILNTMPHMFRLWRPPFLYCSWCSALNVKSTLS